MQHNAGHGSTPFQVEWKVYGGRYWVRAEMLDLLDTAGCTAAPTAASELALALGEERALGVTCTAWKGPPEDEPPNGNCRTL